MRSQFFTFDRWAEMFFYRAWVRCDRTVTVFSSATDPLAHQRHEILGSLCQSENGAGQDHTLGSLPTILVSIPTETDRHGPRTVHDRAPTSRFDSPSDDTLGRFVFDASRYD